MNCGECLHLALTTFSRSILFFLLHQASSFEVHLWTHTLAKGMANAKNKKKPVREFDGSMIWLYRF